MPTPKSKTREPAADTTPRPLLKKRDLSSAVPSSAIKRSKLGRPDGGDTDKSTPLTQENVQKLPSTRRRPPPDFTELSEALLAGGRGNNEPGEDATLVGGQTTVSSRPPGSTFLAQKIRGLINALPALSSRFLPSPKDPLVLDSDGRPIPPPGAVRIQDPELISLLSNPSIMSGSDGRRQSVWSMLDAIQPPSPRDVESIDGSAGYAGSDRSSIMMYSPLIPSADSVIELAELEDVPVVQGAPSSGWWFTWPTWPYIWPFNGWTAKVGVDATSGSSTSQPQPHINTVQEAPVQRQRVWVPSRTQLSFETMWWGYRIYLPPPVLAILDDQSVEAAKQATTVSVALTWFFTNLPISTFPPPVQPAMILLQRLVPFVSYIGTFISWSWSTIRGFDRGHGVILTATWLLPIALIPGTWHARDVPPPPSPAPAPVLELVVPPPPPVPEPLIVELAPSIPAVVRLPPASGDEGPVAGPSRKQRKPSTVEKARTKTTSTLRKLTRTRT